MIEEPDNIGNNIFLIFNFKIYFITNLTYTFYYHSPPCYSQGIRKMPTQTLSVSVSRGGGSWLGFTKLARTGVFNLLGLGPDKIAKMEHIIILIAGQFSNMDIEKQLHQTACSDPVVEGQFLLNNLNTRLVIFPDSIYFQNDKLQCTYAINFDFSYDITKEANGWLLSIYCPEPFRFFSIFHLDDWDRLLLRVIKRRRFHDFYKGVRKIGKGNFASVYLTERVTDKKTFAVKAFQKQSTFKPTNGKQGLQNEINILRRLNHPNITHLEGVYETQNSIYLVMELIEGKNLGELLDQQKILSPSARKKIMKGILSGLAEMESKNVVHRDIKPENIMVNTLGEAKIVDFGLATNTQASSYLYVRCGTPGFVAPEIITIRDTDYAKMSSISDVFSAGAIFYQMIFGKALFEGEKNSEVLQRNRRCLISLPTSSDLASFQELVLLRRMLDIFPETRITASQALRSSFFNDQRTPFQEVNFGQQKNLPPLKYTAAIRARKVKRSQNCEN